MDSYRITWARVAGDQFADLLARAVAADKRPAFVYWFGEVGRAPVDPMRALQVGHPLEPIEEPPGGFHREWVHGCFYIKYAICPDENAGWIYHVKLSPHDWA